MVAAYIKEEEKQLCVRAHRVIGFHEANSFDKCFPFSRECQERDKLIMLCEDFKVFIQLMQTLQHLRISELLAVTVEM